MYIDLHDDTADGAIFYRRVYDLGDIPELIPYAINAPSALSNTTMGYYDNTNPSVVQQYAETYDLPLTDEADGNILTDSIFPVPGTGQYEYKCYNEDPSAFEQMTIGTKPDDFDTNPHYCWFTNWTAADGNLYYCQVPSAKMIWSATEQYWYDKEHKISKRIFAGPISFYISKFIDCDVGYYNNTHAWIQWGANVVRSGYPNTASFTDNPAAHNCMTYNDNPIKYGNYDSYVFDKTNMPSSSGGLTMNGNLCCSCFFVKCSRNNVNYVGLGILQKTYDYFGGAFTRLSLRVIESDIYGDIIHEGDPPEPPTPENWGPDSEPTGADGTFTWVSDNRGDRTGADLETDINTRRTTMYNLCSGNSGYKLHQINTADMQSVFAALYSDDYFQRYKQSFYNPLSAVLAIHMIPSIFISQASASSRLTASGMDISALISSQSPPTFPELAPMVRQHIGDHDMEIVFGAYPDFAPYTKCYLHLPYIGVQEIDVNAIAHGTISVDYVCDLFQGNIAAYVWCQDKFGAYSYKYCAAGNCAYSIPLFANAQDGSAIGKIISAGIGAAAGIAAGNAMQIVGAATTAVSGIADMFRRSTQVSGHFSGNAGMIMDTVCFLEIIRPVWVNPTNYKLLNGIPSMLSGTLSDDGTADHKPYTGFTVCQSIDASSIDATDAERIEIEQLLRAGVFLPTI